MDLRPFAPADVDSAADLVGRAMNADEGIFARRTFEQYFASRAHAIDDGRQLFVLEEAGRIVGITGLHHYNWGPPENVWLSWFAVDPASHGQGLGARLMQATTELARKRGFVKLLIETYSSDTFARARRFYTAKGFEEVGCIRAYMPDGTDMVVYCKNVAA